MLHAVTCPMIFYIMKHFKSTSVSYCFSLQSQLPFPRPVATVISSASWELWFPVSTLASLRHCSRAQSKEPVTFSYLPTTAFDFLFTVKSLNLKPLIKILISRFKQ